MRGIGDWIPVAVRRSHRRIQSRSRQRRKRRDRHQVGTKGHRHALYTAGNRLYRCCLYGYGVSPSPDAIDGDTAKAKAFASGKIAIVADGRWSVVYHRKNTDKTYAWDVAPLPMYKEYDSEGNVTVHGVEAGHSGSVALCINKKSKKNTAAWIFAEYVGGKTGQQVQAESGFAIPSQKDLA